MTFHPNINNLSFHRNIDCAMYVIHHTAGNDPEFVCWIDPGMNMAEVNRMIEDLAKKRKLT